MKVNQRWQRKSLYLYLSLFKKHLQLFDGNRHLFFCNYFSFNKDFFLFLNSDLGLNACARVCTHTCTHTHTGTHISISLTTYVLSCSFSRKMIMVQHIENMGVKSCAVAWLAEVKGYNPVEESLWKEYILGQEQQRSHQLPSQSL